MIACCRYNQATPSEKSSKKNRSLQPITSILSVPKPSNIIQGSQKKVKLNLKILFKQQQPPTSQHFL